MKIRDKQYYELMRGITIALENIVPCEGKQLVDERRQLIDDILFETLITYNSKNGEYGYYDALKILQEFTDDWRQSDKELEEESLLEEMRDKFIKNNG